MKDWLTAPEPKDPLALQVLKAICGVLLAIVEGGSVLMERAMKRRFQFSLRTLLIVVTLFCVVAGGYVGWQKKIVSERKALRQTVERDGGTIYALSDVGRSGWNPTPKSSLEIPWLRQSFGDEAVIEIGVQTGAEYDSEFESANRCFLRQPSNELGSRSL